jgi:hypothetical protein
VTSLIPENGDVVVRSETRDGRNVYVLRTAPGPGQCLLRSRDEAIAQAAAYAEHQGVRVWLTNGGSDFTLVKNFRKPC